MSGEVRKKKKGGDEMKGNCRRTFQDTICTPSADGWLTTPGKNFMSSEGETSVPSVRQGQ